MSLQIKLFFSIGCLLLLVLGANTALHIQDLKRDHLEALEWRSDALAQGIIDSVIEKHRIGLDIEQMFGAVSLQCKRLYNANKDNNVLHVAVIDPAGVIIAHNENSRWNTQIEDAGLLVSLRHPQKITVLQDRVYHALIPIIAKDNSYLGAVDIGSPQALITEKIRVLASQSVGLFGVTFLLTFFAILCLVHFLLTRPLRQLIDLGQNIAAGKLDQIELSSLSSQSPRTRHDEIGKLRVTFCEMINYLQGITQTATRIARGDLSQSLPPRSDDDVLGKAFQQMSQYLKGMADIAATIAEGNLRQSLQPTSEHDVLGMAFHKMETLRQSLAHTIESTKDLRSSSSILSQISSKMTSNATNASDQVHAVSSSSQQVSVNMRNISSATEEMSASIHEISRNANKVMQVVLQAVDSTRSASSSIADLEVSSQEIGEISQVITTITQQTNLLALNAAIESARAGEVGKGFAVVAHEVKELARQIALAADDITQKISAMQKRTLDASDAMTSVASIIQNVEEISHAISSAVEQQAATTSEISSNILHASEGSDDVTRTIVEITNTSHITQEQAQEVQRASENLAILADQLQESVGTFQI